LIERVQVRLKAFECQGFHARKQDSTAKGQIGIV
jgi:hypothetical protein